MGVQGSTCVFWKNSYQFGAHDIAVDGGHESKPTWRLGCGEDGANRLDNFSSRKCNERISHIRDERIEIEHFFDIFRSKMHENHLHTNTARLES